MDINLCSAHVREDATSLLEQKINSKKLVLIAGIKALKAASKLLQIDFEQSAAMSVKNTAQALKIGRFDVFFTDKPEREQAQMIAASAKKFAPEMILAVGGGVVCDVAKLVAHTLKVSIITVPTIAATCASTSALSVLYKNHALDGFAIYDDLELEMIADLGILRSAPKQYLLAGIGDTVAKYYESALQMRVSKQALDYANLLGAAIAPLCANLILESDLDKDFEQIIMAILLNTGLVSRLIRPDFNGALAHASCYGLIACGANGLHGELVAFGLLVQFALMQESEEFAKLQNMLKRLNMPHKLSDFIDPKLFNEKKFCDYVLACEDVQNLRANDFDLSALAQVASSMKEW